MGPVAKLWNNVPIPKGGAHAAVYLMPGPEATPAY